MRAGLCAALLICVQARSLVAKDLLIRNATIIDVTAGTEVPHRSILIRGTQISAIGAVVHASKETRIVEAAGNFVIPGLWDMRVHLTSRDQLPIYASLGITGVRDFSSDYDRVNLWRDEVQKGRLIGPHIETCGRPLGMGVVRTPNEARAIYDQLADEGVDFIGILPDLPRDAYLAVIERARKYYSGVAGDVPAAVSAMEAVEARQKSIDHLSGIVLACSTEERRFRAAYIQAMERGDGEALQEVMTAAFETFSSRREDALFERMVLFETRSVPVLANLGDRERWDKIVLDMQRAGVAILAGTDNEKPGDALHNELESFVRAGLSPAQALRSATLEPAKYLDAVQTLGTVEPGKTADLVILDADPLTDIRNVRKIVGVVLAGKYFSKTYLHSRR
jgi:imidazolonepropionase-like amidohydrolase